jgi:hypothetical protein
VVCCTQGRSLWFEVLHDPSHFGAASVSFQEKCAKGLSAFDSTVR